MLNIHYQVLIEYTLKNYPVALLLGWLTYTWSLSGSMANLQLVAQIFATMQPWYVAGLKDFRKGFMYICLQRHSCSDGGWGHIWSWTTVRNGDELFATEARYRWHVADTKCTNAVVVQKKDIVHSAILYRFSIDNDRIAMQVWIMQVSIVQCKIVQI